MHDVQPALSRVERTLEALARLAGRSLRLWREAAGRLEPASGGGVGFTLAVPAGDGAVATPEGAAWLAAVPGNPGVWVAVAGDDGELAQGLVPVLGAQLESEVQLARLASELADRYEEVDLLYAISEILGQTLRVEEATRTILREVSGVVGARRAALLVYDGETDRLQVMASRGHPPATAEAVAPDAEGIVAAAYRERQAQSAGGEGGAVAVLAVPVCYAAPGAATRCVGVLVLADRAGGGEFSAGNRKLVAAVANQVGAALENARLMLRDLKQQRVRRELELAHDLQLKLLPSPEVLAGLAESAVRFLPAETVGGDFYSFHRLSRRRVGVMLGDVSSHGFAAALVMASVMSAAGIHAGSSFLPDETLIAMLDSLHAELDTAEMYFTIFYGVLNPSARMLVYANAGHPHAWRIPGSGEPQRLAPGSLPIGLGAAADIVRTEVPWVPGEDLLCLFTDGLVEARDAEGTPFGEEQLVEALVARRALDVTEIVEQVIGLVDAHDPDPVDDRTLLVLRI